MRGSNVSDSQGTQVDGSVGQNVAFRQGFSSQSFRQRESRGRNHIQVGRGISGVDGSLGSSQGGDIIGYAGDGCLGGQVDRIGFQAFLGSCVG